MTHLDDDIIAAAALGEPEGAAADVSRHLGECDRCRTELEAIRSTLAAAATLTVPERGDDYGARVWAALEPSLPASPAERSSRVTNLRPWLAAAALLVAVTGAFVAGRWSTEAPPPGPSVAAKVAPEAIRERVVLSALADHLDRTERTLVELVNLPGNGRVNIAAEQAWARDLLDANRLYRRAAGATSSPALAELLDDLEPVLLEIANSPTELSIDDYVALRDRIEERSLVFKVRATGRHVRDQEQKLIREGVKQS
jgi:hypothetical protein